MTPQRIAEIRKRLGCLVPREGADSVITSHEKSLCDCEVLELLAHIDALSARVEELEKALTEYANHAEDSGWHNLAQEIRARLRERSGDE